MLTSKLFLTTALLFLTHNGADGAPGSPVGRKLLQHPASSWTVFQRVQGKELPSWLSWELFRGELPADTVSNWNAYTNVTEYVCLTLSWHCSIGSYVPSRGPFCYFAYGELALRSYEFKVLVNKGKFEALQWVDDSFGDVPENAVEGCESFDIYVGRNRYGLGKVSKEQRALFVAVDGKEVWFKWYQVLTVKTGPANITISGVLYNVSAAVEHSEDVTITKTTVKNEGCQGTRQDVTLEEATEVEHDWELDQEIFSSIRGVLEAGLLAFNGMSWEATSITNVTWLGKASAALSQRHRLRAALGVPYPHPTLDLLGKDAEELLENQQLQDLLFAPPFRAKPTPGELPKPPTHSAGPRSLLITELPEPQPPLLRAGTPKRDPVAGAAGMAFRSVEIQLTNSTRDVTLSSPRIGARGGRPLWTTVVVLRVEGGARCWWSFGWSGKWWSLHPREMGLLLQWLQLRAPQPHHPTGSHGMLHLQQLPTPFPGQRGCPGVRGRNLHPGHPLLQPLQLQLLLHGVCRGDLPRKSPPWLAGGCLYEDVQRFTSKSQKQWHAPECQAPCNPGDHDGLCWRHKGHGHHVQCCKVRH
uniref:Uncharacterized protein n=1 Tax=Gallus gallus TaxID=9031 RepID=A0A8V0XNZ0_CHICK